MIKFRIQFIWLCLIRLPIKIWFDPIFKLKLLWRRVLFTVSRKFIGPSFTSPITGEKIFNIQTLVNSFSMQAIGELDGRWMNHVRESISPIVFDVGSNVGQFSALARSLNPACKIFTWDAWSEMSDYVTSSNHRIVALGCEKGNVFLCRSEMGWTASTDGSVYGYFNVIRSVPVETLDNEWRRIGKPKIDVLKIDVDGAEFDVIAGAREAIGHARFVIIETNNPKRLKELLPGRRWYSVNRFDWQGELI